MEILNEQDFIFIKKDELYQDYWFECNGDSQKILTKKYMEMCMVEVSEVVYSKSENIIGVKRLFPFNYDVIIPDDNELKNILLILVSKVDKEIVNNKE